MVATAKKPHSPMIDAALRYAAAGYRVVVLHGVDPSTKRCTCKLGTTCKNAGKHPRFKDWTKTATTNPDTLAKQFTTWPNSNIGITPQPGTLVIDVDPRNGGDARGLKLPARTPTQLTGGGGAHYIVKVAEGAQLPKLPGIDYRYADRNQIVVEPSVHVSGGRYVWQLGLSYDVPPAMWRHVPTTPAPAASSLAPELTPLEVPETLDAPADVVAEWLAVVPSETYGDWINVGQALKHAYGEDAFQLWDTWSSKSDKYPGADALMAKWDSFDKNRDRALRTLRTVRHMAQQNGWRYTPPELEFSSDLWRSGLVADLVSTTPPPMEWVIGTVLPRNKVVMLGGPGGSGKSFLMLVIASQHTLGVPLLGVDSFAPTAPASDRKVIYFTAEDDRDDIHRRLHAVFDAYMVTDEAKEDVGAQFSVKCTRGQDWRLVEDVGGQLVASRAADLIIDKLRSELGLSLIMFDPSIMFAGVEENDNAAAAVYMRVLDRIASELNCAVLVGTHTNKSVLTAEVVDQGAIRGASALVDNARGSWILRTMTENEAAAHNVANADRHRYACLRVTKNNYGPAGMEVWLERVAGGALKVANLPSMSAALTAGGTGGTAMPPLVQDQPTTRNARTRNTIRAAQMHAHAVELLRYVHGEEGDPLGGSKTVSERTMGADLWGRDAVLTSEGIRNRVKRVLDYLEAMGMLKVQRPDDEDARRHQPTTYMITTLGRKQLD